MKMRTEVTAVPAVAPARIGYRAEARASLWTGERAQAVRGAVRRGLNLAVALVMIVLLLPLMVLIGIVIKLTSAGPILY
ncbi:MAG: hypothetical protein ACRELX_10935, partial [Longimicrobiales bacterium]